MSVKQVTSQSSRGKAPDLQVVNFVQVSSSRYSPLDGSRVPALDGHANRLEKIRCRTWFTSALSNKVPDCFHKFKAGTAPGAQGFDANWLDNVCFA